MHQWFHISRTTEQLQHQRDNTMLMKVKDADGLVRDTQSRAILNVNKNVLLKDQMYQEQLKKEKHMEASINNLKEEVSSIKSDISKILEMLSNRGE